MRLTKKSAAILIFVLLAFAVMPMLPFTASTAHAVDKVTFIGENNESKTIDSYYTVDELADAEGISMYDGNAPGKVSYYVVKGNKTFENRLNAFGEVHLILLDGAKLTLKNGLHVPPGSSIHICAQSRGGNMGKLVACGTNSDGDYVCIGTKYAAAIGGNDEQTNGDIIINGGDITAIGHDYGAGIGSGDEADAGRIIINGGKINARGGYDAAGIGGGNEGNAGNIKINDGDINAVSGFFAAAIGGGDDGDGYQIQIHGGKVKAVSTGHDYGFIPGTTSHVAGAGIGGGRHGNAGLIEITGGEINAKSLHRGAAIGSGGDNDSSSHAYKGGSFKGGEINISGGSIVADPNSHRESTMQIHENGGAGIGSGAESYGVKVSIFGGHTTAYGSYYDYEYLPDSGLHTKGLKPSACIGNGYGAESPGQVTISGDEESKTFVYAIVASNSETENRQYAFGAAPDSDECAVTLSYPRARVERNRFGEVLDEVDRYRYIIETPYYDYKISWCEHDKADYESDETGHWKHCTKCGADVPKDNHKFSYVSNEDKHWQVCGTCGYESNKEDHSLDSENGKCVCGVSGVKVTIHHGQASHSGGDIIRWVKKGEKLTLEDPQEIGFVKPELCDFKYWKVNGNWDQFAPGEDLIIQSETEITPVYETSWQQFKSLVESAEDGATVVLPGNCHAPGDATHIVIASGKSLTLDLNGYELSRGSCDVKVSDGMGDGDVIAVRGSLKVTDSSSTQKGRISGGSNIRFDGDSVIDESIGAGGVSVHGGTFVLEGGTISGNVSNKGGGVGVYAGGTFKMTGGKIEKNICWSGGSAVFVHNGVFKAEGGTISGNQAFNERSGAVQKAAAGHVRVSGSPEIIGNMGADRASDAFVPANVYLSSEQTIEVVGSLSDSAVIGVSSDGGTGTQITTGLSGRGSISSFISDSSDTAFADNGSGEIKLIASASAAQLHDITAEITGNGKVSLDVSKAKAGDKVSIHAIPDEGYRFSQWSVQGEGASIKNTDAASTILTMGSADVTVNVSFVKDSVPVTGVAINVKKGETETPLADGSKLELQMGEKLTLSASVKPSDAADKSVAWSEDSEGGIVTVSQEGLVTAKKAGLAKVTATAAGGASSSVWVSVAARYTVTFDTDGGEGVNEEVNVGSNTTVARPEDPTRTDYRFVGWRKVKKDGSLEQNNYDFTEEVKDSFTLKAVWAHTKHDDSTLVKHDFRASTCTEEGQAEYWHCSVCGKNFIFIDDGEVEEVSDEYIVIPSGHVFSNWEPLDEEKHKRVCKRDGCSHSETENHIWDRGEVTTEPTDTKEGIMTYTCEVCKEKKTESITVEDIKEYTVDTYINGPDGSGDITTEPVKGVKGTKIHLTAFPAEGYVFGGWNIKGAACSNPKALSTVITIEKSNVEAEGTFLLSINKAKLVLSNESVTYNAKVQKPKVKTVGDNRLKADTDYTMVIKDSKGNKVSSPKNAGRYTVTVKGKGNCTGTSASATFTIKKAANPMKLRGRTAKVQYSKLRKKAKALAVSRVIKFRKKLSDKKSYTLSSAKKGKKSYKKYFKINKKTGKVTVKKGLKKGKYKIKVKVKALGNKNYKPSAVKTVTFKVKVK